MTGPFSNKAKWIRQQGVCCADWRAKVEPAPFLRKTFTLDGGFQKARAMICGLGYYELYLNGRKVGDHVLDPVPSQYDKRARYVVYEIGEGLVAGENVVGVILGTGWYNCHTPEVWHFDKASWRDCPKLLFQLDVDGQPAVVSDDTWKASSGPIVFDGLRNGETYDARLELGAWASSGFDDSSWRRCERVSPPGGILQEQTMPPCKVVETLRPVANWDGIAGSTVYDFGQNISGWCRVKASGARGTTLRIVYGERLAQPDRTVDQNHISKLHLIEAKKFQTDRYIMKGGGEESWEPRFTYHGFQYAQIFPEGGDAGLLEVEACFVHTAFSGSGEFSCSDETANRLQDCTRRSYKGNFVGFPTDCPHREKNGWTGDAQLASETGLWNFDAASSYAHWLDSFADAQRPSGQLPGIVPSSGWGFNWGSGPAWDSAFLIIPWNVYLYTGDKTLIERHYDSMKRYVDYCSAMAKGGLVSFGLGDWGALRNRMADPRLNVTAYYFEMLNLLSRFAGLLGNEEDRKVHNGLATDVKKAFNEEFYRGNGIYEKGGQTAQGCALYHGLVEEGERAEVVERLVEAVKATGCKPDFGILGAKAVPRALAENGHAALAFKLITQREFPGWGNWIEKGANTLWECWFGSSSLNHIMYGDISAWMYQYLGGLRPLPEEPGFKRFAVSPCFVEEVSWVKASHRSSFGVAGVEWRRNGAEVLLKVDVPAGCVAEIDLPEGVVAKGEGHHEFSRE